MKKYFSLLLLLVLTSTLVNAQSGNKRTIEYSGFFDSYYWRGPWSFTAGVSVPLYSGDLCDGLDCNEINTGFLFGIGYKVWPRVFFGGEVHSFTLGAKSTKQGPYLSMNSNLIGMKIFGRFYLREDIIHRHSQINKKPKVFKPYFLLGVSTFYANAEVLKTDNSAFTNGGALILAVPVGIGFSFDFSRRFSAILEVHGDYTLSDKLDGINAGGSNDAFIMAEVKLQYSPWAKRLKPKKVHFDGPASSSPAGGGSGNKPETSSAPAPYTPPPTEEETPDEEPAPVETLPEDQEDYEYDSYEETPSEEESQEESSDDDWGSPDSW